MGRPEWASLWVMLGNRTPRWREISRHRRKEPHRAGGALAWLGCHLLAGDATTATFSRRKTPWPGAGTPGFVLPRSPQPCAQAWAAALGEWPHIGARWAAKPCSLESATSQFHKAPTGQGTSCSAGWDQVPGFGKVARSAVGCSASSQCVPGNPSSPGS